MTRNDRSLVDVASFHTTEEILAKADQLLTRLPGHPDYPDEEVAEFGMIAGAIDQLTPEELLQVLKRGKVRVPAVYALDSDRLVRYVLYRWREPQVRAALTSGINLKHDKMSRAVQLGQLEQLPALYRTDGVFLSDVLVIRGGHFHRLPEVMTGWSPEERKHREAWYRYGQALMQRLLHQPPIIWQKCGFQKRRRLIQCIRRRDLQLQSMRRSLYQVGRERKVLISRVWQAEREAAAEMDRLAAELKRLQQELAEAEVRHAETAAAAADRWCAEVDAAQREVEALTRDFAEALAERSAWAPDTPLTGLAVTVVGDDARADGYRTLIEAAGGRFTHVSAVEKLNRVPEAVAGADIVILMTDVAKHAAEHRLRKAAGPGALILRCPKAGLASFDRVVRSEVLPRIVMRHAASAGLGGETHGVG
ncbi:MAG TPA: DUF2325 domain-containing protein [Symbiobacteriaceae bacterium]|jgi:hypothetical protein